MGQWRPAGWSQATGHLTLAGQPSVSLRRRSGTPPVRQRRPSVMAGLASAWAEW